MARLPRLVVARHAHLVVLRSHSGQPVFEDLVDRRQFLAALQAACVREGVALHAYALPRDRAWILCTPAEARSLSRAMQSLGRRFAADFNRRQARSGSLWDGRFRATVVEAGATLLEVLVFVDQACSRQGIADGPDSAWSSARQHLGSNAAASLSDLPEYWSLGNTPFERAAAYGRLLEEPLSEPRIERIGAAAEKGWALGSDGFLAQLQGLSSRPLAPRPRGRPRKSEFQAR